MEFDVWMLITFAAIASALIALHILSIVIAGRRLSRQDTPNSFSHKKPPVSLVIPLRGIEAFTSLTLARAFQIQWPTYEILFCVADSNDPVVPFAKEFIQRNPHVSAVLLVGDDNLSPNPKLNNCVKGWRAAQHDWVVIADSNVLMRSSYITKMMAAWRDDTGLVCSPPLGSNPVGFWAEVECAFLNTFQARYQYAAEAIGNGFAQGKSMLWHKPFLDSIGGIASLGAEIAEDAAATKLVRAAGRSVHLVSGPFEQPLGRRTMMEVCSRQARWACLRRATFPAFFAPEILAGAFPPVCFAVAFLGLGDLGFTGSAVVILVIGVAMYVPEMVLALRKGWHVSVYTLPALFVRDLLLPAIWFRGWVGHSVSWRGNVLAIKTKRSTLGDPEFL